MGISLSYAFMLYANLLLSNPKDYSVSSYASPPLRYLLELKLFHIIRASEKLFDEMVFDFFGGSTFKFICSHFTRSDF